MFLLIIICEHCAMKKIILIAITTSTILTAGLASAEGNLALGLKGGTTGLGLEATYNVAPWLNLRGTGTGYLYSNTFSGEEFDIDSTLRFGFAGVLADVHPFSGSFRVSVGAMVNLIEVNSSADNITVDGDELPNADFSAKLDYPTFAPYVGLGWGNVFRGGRLSFMVDLGVIYTQLPEFSVTGSSGDADPVVEDDFQEVLSEFQAEGRTAINDLEWLQFWPVVSLGLSYRF